MSRIGGTNSFSLSGGFTLQCGHGGVKIGYARCSTDEQDLTTQRLALVELGVDGKRIYLDHGLSGTNRKRPGLDQALAAVRKGDTLVVPKPDRSDGKDVL